jgi:coatomer subunit epsilon
LNILYFIPRINPYLPTAHRAIKLLAGVTAEPSKRESALKQLNEWLNEGNYAANTTLQLVAAIVHIQDDNLKEAVKLVHRGVNLEQRALLVQLYLRMDRTDLAQKEAKVMKSADEDSTLSMLASAWTNLAVVSTCI